MTNDEKPQQKIPTWAFMTGGAGVTLAFVGIITGNGSINAWIVGGCVVSGVGLIALIISSKQQNKKG